MTTDMVRAHGVRAVTICVFALWLAAATAPAWACGCEIECKPGDVYSDEENGCVPDASS